MPQSLTNLIRNLKPYWLDDAAAISAIEINKIIYFPVSGPAVFYDKTAANLTIALAGMLTGETVVIHGPCTLSANFTVPAGGTLSGVGRDECVLDGLVTLESGANIEMVTILRVANDANDLIGVINTDGAIPAVVYDCVIDVRQSGAGNAYAVAGTASAHSGYGEIYVKYSRLYASSVGGSGYAARSTAGAITIWHTGNVYGSTDRFTTT